MNADASAQIAFSPDAREWMACGGYTVRERSADVVVANEGGEIRYCVAGSEPDFIVTRADRAVAPMIVFESAAGVDVERFLSAEIGADVRSGAGFGVLRIPIRERDVAAGFETVLFADDASGLRRSTGELLPLRFGGSHMGPAVGFSYYADASPADIRQSFADPLGAPLFTAFAL